MWHFFSKDLGIDLGTVNSIVYVKGEGIVLNEPTTIAINTKTGEIAAIGVEAKKMSGKTPPSIVIKKPLISGVISDFEVAESFFQYFVETVHQKSLFKPFVRPRAVIGVPSNLNEVEAEALKDAAISAGIRDVFLIPETIASALGANLDIMESNGVMVVDMGGGTTDISVISLGGIVIGKTIPIAGETLDNDIIQYIRQEHHLLISQSAAENLKIKLGTVSNKPTNETEISRIRGRDLITGLPQEIIISRADIKNAIMPSILKIVQSIRSIIEQTPPDILSDLLNSSIIFSGGGSLIDGLAMLISKSVNLPVLVVDDPLTAVARGCGAVVEKWDYYKKNLLK